MNIENGYDLTGKAVIITGSGRGLGRAYALWLAKRGASIVVNDMDADAAQATTDEILAAGGSAVSVVAPVGDTEVAQQLVSAAVSAFRRLDALIANAGVLRDRVSWKMSDKDFDLVVRTHLRGTFLCGREVIRHLREQGTGGRLIVIGSPAGQLGSFGQSNYAAVKSGLVAMARTWSMELARDKITANAVVPTAMTAMTATIPMYKDWAEQFEQGQELPPLARQEHALGSPEDVAPLLEWLVSDASAHVTGQAIGIGGDRLTLYSHPTELVNEIQEGGWSAAGIDAAWSHSMQEHAQPSGPIPRPAPETQTA